MRYHGGRSNCVRFQQFARYLPCYQHRCAAVGHQQVKRHHPARVGLRRLGRGPLSDPRQCPSHLILSCADNCTQCSHEENFEWLNIPDDNTTAVKIANPKTLEFQVVRTSLLPGLLKTVRENRSHALPIRIFETSDVVFKDATRERQTRNERHAAAVWCNKTAGFEVVHGLLDRAMSMLEVPRITSTDFKAEAGYYIKEASGGLLR